MSERYRIQADSSNPEHQRAVERAAAQSSTNLRGYSSRVSARVAANELELLCHLPLVTRLDVSE